MILDFSSLIRRGLLADLERPAEKSIRADYVVCIFEYNVINQKGGNIMRKKPNFHSLKW